MRHNKGPWSADRLKVGDVRLIAAAPEMARILEDVEWGTDDTCPACGEIKDSGHDKDCALSAVLKSVK